MISKHTFIGTLLFAAFTAMTSLPLWVMNAGVV